MRFPPMLWAARRSEDLVVKVIRLTPEEMPIIGV